jgi:transposase
VRNTRVWREALGLTCAVVDGVEVDEAAEAIVVAARPTKRARGRCGRCGQRSPGYDRGEGRRRWRALDAGTTRVFIEADAPRVNCPIHGPTVEQVPWARHNSGHTYQFDETVAWLAVQCSKSAVLELMRIAWRTVGAIITRVCADIDGRTDRLAGLRRIGIDEISYKRNHKYLTVVVDHDTGRLVWAAKGRDSATLQTFFDLLGEQRCTEITHVSADGARWIASVVTKYCPTAKQCRDPFHVIAWATEALDEVRRTIWNEVRGGRRQGQAGIRRANWPRRSNELARVRWALWKNPERLSEHQHHQLEWIAGNHPDLWRAYRLKEALRYVFAVKGEEGKQALDRWIAWACRCRLQPFIDLARRIRTHRTAIDAALDSGLSNARVESINTKIRLLTRIAFGFHNADALIALAMLALGSHSPTLPSRKTHG